MTQRQFGYKNPFNGQGARGQQYAQQVPQQQQAMYEDDPDFETSAYMKIGFNTTQGVKYLNFGKTDKRLRDASPLEHMILEYWRNGGDVNDLLNDMHIEIVDANPDYSDLAFASVGVPQLKPKAPKKATKPRATRAPVEEPSDIDDED